MKCIVTGFAGFIGQHLVKELINRNYQVIGIDDLSIFPNAEWPDRKFESHHSIIKNINELDVNYDYKEFHNVDAIFHLAANSDISKSSDDPGIDYEKTFLTTMRMLQIARKYSIKDFIFASTSAIYGDTGTISVTETYGPLRPVSNYGAAKLASEAFISSYAENYGIKTWVIRFPNVVGGNMTHGAIFDFINKLKDNNHHLDVLGNGTQRKPYIHVKELVDTILYIWMTSACKVNVYNVAPMDGSLTSVKNMAEWCAKEFNCKDIRYGKESIGWIGDINTFNYNIEKLRRLGFEVKLSSDEAVKKAIKELIHD